MIELVLSRLPHGTCLMIFGNLGAITLPFREAVKLCAEHLTDATVDERARQTLDTVPMDPSLMQNDFARAEVLTALLDKWAESARDGKFVVWHIKNHGPTQ